MRDRRNYRRGAASPDLVLVWLDASGAPLDLSLAGTFTLYLWDGAAAPALTKTTGLTGAKSGALTVDWADNDLDIAPDTYECLVYWSRDDRWWPGELDLRILPVPITPAP